MPKPLTKAQRVEMTLLARDPKNGTSNRLRDQERTKLKKLGFIAFDRKAWTWTITELGRAALEASNVG